MSTRHISAHCWITSGFLLAFLLSSGLFRVAVQVPAEVEVAAAAFIVQADSGAAARAAVEAAGGVVTQQLDIIHGVAARLDETALMQLYSNQTVVIHADRVVYRSEGGDGTDSSQETDTNGYLLYPAAAVGAHLLHEQKVWTPKTECKDQRVIRSSDQEERELQGWGVTVAVVDTGFMRMSTPGSWRRGSNNTLYAENSGRCIIYRDFTTPGRTTNSADQNGHGTHVLSTIADNREVTLATNMNATPTGVAPQANLVVARALGMDGAGSYTQVIAAIQWIVQNRVAYNIRVLNLSLYAPVSGPYWDDPLNQAVMRAWQAGIVVVTVAGNDGPEAGTIGVPGNVPYVITVGAVRSGRYTTSGEDELAVYSSRGPTESAFVKPDVVVPATRTIAPMPDNGHLTRDVRDGRLVETASVDYKIGSPFHRHSYYQLSGTSMAAAQVSGIVALILQRNPTLTNDQVKYRLMATARPAVNEETSALAYTLWEQGAGLVHTEHAVFTTTLEAANGGMDIALDLDPTSTEHYWGYTVWDETSNTFQLRDPNTGELLTWNGGRRSWARSTDTWAGSEALWAGSARPWIRSTSSLSSTLLSQAELVLHDDEGPAVREPFSLLLPLLVQQ